MMALLPILGGIVQEGMKAWNEERRTRFMDRHHDILERLNNAENAQGEDYSDAELNLAQEELATFLTAYHSELSAHNKEG